MPSVVITGAPTGIGWGTAKLPLRRGFRMVDRFIAKRLGLMPTA